LNIRQRILSDLATLETETEVDLLTTRELIQSKAPLADEERSAPNGDSVELDVEPRSFMVRAHSLSEL
jgi:phosphatidylinositol 4-kinase